MRTFPAHPLQFDLGHRQFLLYEPYRYGWIHEGRANRITIPDGFVHDGASVPGIVRSIVPPEPFDRAAVIHDWLYRHAGLLPVGSHERWEWGGWVDALTDDFGERHPWTRRDADRLFFRQMREDPQGPSRLRRRMGYRAVWAFGAGSWQMADNPMDKDGVLVP